MHPTSKKVTKVMHPHQKVSGLHSVGAVKRTGLHSVGAVKDRTALRGCIKEVNDRTALRGCIKEVNAALPH